MNTIPLIILAVCLLVFLPWLWYFARKPGQHPRFRPKLGELLLIALLGLGACLGVTVVGAKALGTSLMKGPDLGDPTSKEESADQFKGTAESVLE